MKIIKGYLIDRTTGLGISGKTVSFEKLDGSAVGTAETYWQSVDALTQSDGSFTGMFELSPGPIDVTVDVSGSEKKVRKGDERAQASYQWLSDIQRIGRVMGNGVIRTYLNGMAVSAPSGHTIRIATGAALIEGAVFSIENGALDVAGTANPSGPANPRLDLVSLKQYKESAAGQLSGKQEVIITEGTISNVVPSAPSGSDFTTLPLGVMSTAQGSGTKTVHTDSRVFVNSPNVGMKFLNSGIVVGGSSFVISPFSASYANYRIVIDLLTADALPNYIAMRLRDGGGDNSTSNYHYTNETRRSDTGAAASRFSGSGESAFILINQATGTPMSDGSLIIDVLGPAAAEKTKFSSRSENWNDGLGCAMNGDAQGIFNTISQFTGATFYNTSGGTVTCIWKLYGYNDSALGA